MSGPNVMAIGSATVPHTPIHITSSGTITPFAGTCKISQIVITVTTAGTTWTIKIQNKEATPKVLYINSGTGVLVGTTVITLNVSALMVGGVDIITAGTPGIMDVFIS
jgi:hypothetical protein